MVGWIKKTNRRKNNDDNNYQRYLARFGYDVYLKWSSEEIDHEWLTKMLNAERARDKQKLLSLEGIIFAMISAQMSKKPQKGVRKAQEIMKQDIRVARGEG